jgi:hypothetical protein
MQTSETLGKFADALAKAQGTMKAATKNALNPHYSSRYADLDAIMDACRVALSAHGIAVNQFVTAVEALVTVTTRLTHTSGEWVASSLPVRARDATPQSIGSAISYGRRYGLAALAGVVADEDDDGEAAQAKPATKPPAAQKPLPTSSPSPGPGPAVTAARANLRAISEPQRKRLFAIAKKEQSWTDDDLKKLIATFGYESSKDIRLADYDAIVNAIMTGEVGKRAPGEDDAGGFGDAPWEGEKH